MNNIEVGDIVGEYRHIGATSRLTERQIKRLASWYMGIVVRVCNVNSCVSYMNYEGRILTNFTEKLARLNDR